MGASPLSLPQSGSQVSLLTWHLLGSSDVLWSALPSPHLSLGTATSWPWGPCGLATSPAPLKSGSRTTGVGPRDLLWGSGGAQALALCARVQEAPTAQAASVSRGRTRGPHDVLWVRS